jgi:hypothetical protein
MRRALVVVLLAAGLAACPAPADVTPIIHVDPRAAGRLDWLGKPAGSSGDAAQPRPARVHVMKDGEQLGGPNAIGRPGDLLLENDEVAFVVDQLGSSSGFAETGGNLVDAADARARKDELGQLFAYFGTFPRQGVYDTVTSGTDSDGSAWIEARGKELYEPRLAVATRYTPPTVRCSSRRRWPTRATHPWSCPRWATPCSGAVRRRSPPESGPASRGPPAGLTSAASVASPATP